MPRKWSRKDAKAKQDLHLSSSAYTTAIISTHTQEKGARDWQNLTHVQMHLVWNTWEKTKSMKKDSGSALSSEFFAWSCDGKENVTSWLIAWLTNTTKANIKTSIWNQNVVKVKYKHKRRRKKWTCTWKRNQTIFGSIYNSSCRKSSTNHWTMVQLVKKIKIWRTDNVSYLSHENMSFTILLQFLSFSSCPSK